MTIKLPIMAKEGSTFGIKVNFIEKTTDDQDDSPFTPNDGLTWSLKAKDGSTVNNKLDVPIDSAESIIIVLSGNDLALSAGVPVERYVTIKGTYDSVLGNNLVLIDEVSFQIENLVGVS